MKVTSEQQRVVDHTGGHAKVLAGAGSGKSTTMVARIVRLLESGMPQESILVIMFNKDASESFKEKLRRQIGQNKITVKTFHSLGYALLRELLPKDEKWQLVTNEYQVLSMCREVLARYAPDQGKRVSFAAAKNFDAFVGLVKSVGGDPLNVFSKHGISVDRRYYLTAFSAFEKERKQKKILTFSDQIYDSAVLLEQKKHREKVQNRYDEIIVDECQDICPVQERMVLALAGTRAKVMVVGDDDQTIYEWRGANPSYMVKDFDQSFKGATTYLLSKTFRFGHQIALAANYLISNNKARAPKVTTAAPGATPTTLVLDTAAIAQPSVTKHVNEWVSTGGKLADVAVLVRSFSQAIPVELSFLNEGMPYRVIGGNPLLESGDIQALICSMHLATGTFKELPEKTAAEYAISYLLNPDPGIPQDERKHLLGKIRQDPLGFCTILDDYQFNCREQYIRERVRRRVDSWRNLDVMASYGPAAVIDFALDANGFIHAIKYKANGDESEEEEMMRVFESFKAYITHRGGDLLDTVQHLEGLMQSYKQSASESADSVLITSMHRSKGLEWPLVILPGLAQGKVPHIPKDPETADIEGERRLFFVAMTRATHKLVLIAPQDRRLNSKAKMGDAEPPRDLIADNSQASQFLYESNIYLSQNADRLIESGVVPEKAVSKSVAEDYLKALSAT